jgi:osmotically-inducible protein OsmY
MPSPTNPAVDGRCHEIEQQAGDCLSRNPYFSGRDVCCECDRGTLVLRGRLRTYFQKQAAQECVKWLEGVDQIANHIEVVD